MKYLERSGKILFTVIALVLLYLCSLYNYLLFHSLAEIFSICIAVAVFLVTLNSARFLQNKYLVIVGFAYLFIGFLDLMHTISYKGMAIFTDYDYHANQLWVAARYFESLVLLISFLLIKSKKSINLYLLLGIYTVVTSVIILSVFVWHIFPIAFIEGVGQTPFKIISEYIIIAILLTAIFVLRKNKDTFDPKVYRFLLFSLICTIASEFCFTTYINNYGITNLLGHYFKILSFYFIYRTIIQTGIREPYDLIFREMKQTEQQLFEQNQSLSNKTVADGLTIKEHIALLQEQYKLLNRQSKMLDLSHEAIFAWDIYGNIFYWNKGAELMYGYTPEEAINKTSDELLRTIRPVSLEETEALLERTGRWVGELIHTTKDGRRLTVESAHQLYSDEEGKKVVLELCRDVTERNKLEADIRYRNILLYAVIENMHDALIVFDSKGDITSINARARAMYPDHFTDKTTVFNVFEGYKCYDLNRNLLPISEYPSRRAFRGENISNEKIIIESDTWSRIIEVNATPIVDARENILAIVVCHHDITDIIKKEQDLKYQRNLLSAIIENMNDALFIYDSTGKPMKLNEKARDLYKIDLEDNTTFQDIRNKITIFRLDRQTVPYEQYPLTLALRGETISNEPFIVESGNSSKFIEINSRLIKDAQGQLAAVVIFNHDITELIKRQKAIEENIIQLQQQNKVLNRQAKLLDLSDEAIFAWYMDGPIIYWNQGAEKMYGYKDDDAVGCLPHNLLSSRFPISYEKLKAHLLEHGSWSGLIDHTTKDGRLLCIESRQQIIINELGLNTVLESNRDVTERIRAENAVKKSEIELKNIINSTDDFIYSVDMDYRFILCNNAFNSFVKEYYGIEIKPGMHLMDILKENYSSFSQFFDRVKLEGEFSTDMHTFRGDKDVTYSFHPVYFDDELIGITIFGRDISERLKAEQEIIKLNTSLEARVTERTEELHKTLETLRNFSMTVTHDLKMPLQEICRYTAQIKENIDVEENSEKISELCSKANVMLGELLDYERLSRASLKKQAVDIGTMITSVFEDLKSDKAVLDFQTGMPKVIADKSLMKHVIVNLISNALKYSSKRSVSKITVGCKLEGNEYVFSIKDNGIGIDMEYAGKLFNAFERLQSADEYEGHGIGLATVRNIITKHGGRTWINGKVNVGTTVYFTLPAEAVEEN